MGISYTIINHSARKEFGLSPTEYMVADLIYNLSNNPESDYPQWCYASKETMGDMLGLSKQSIHTIINTLLRKELIEKHSITKHLKTTPKWYKEAILKQSKETLPRVKNLDLDSKESLLGHSKESLHNNDIYNKDSINNFTNVKEKYGDSSINELGEYFKTKMQIPKEGCTQKQSRQYWHLLLKESKTGIAGVKWLIDMATQDTFYRNNITSSKALYYKRIDLIARTRGNLLKKGEKFFDAEQELKSMEGDRRKTGIDSL